MYYVTVSVKKTAPEFSKGSSEFL